MSSRRYEVDTEVDVSGTVAALLFGGVVGLFLIYPALPGKFQAFDPTTFRVTLGPVAAPLIGGVALFMLFVLGIVFLNWFYIETE